VVVSEQNEDRYAEMLSDLWEYLKAYGEPEHTTQYWREADQAALDYVAKYKQDPMAVGLINGAFKGLYDIADEHDDGPEKVMGL
jgi:hypothetical protein